MPNRLPFDVDGLRTWADLELPLHRNMPGYLIISREQLDTLRADLLAAADEIEMLMIERTKEAA